MASDAGQLALALALALSYEDPQPALHTLCQNWGIVPRGKAVLGGYSTTEYDIGVTAQRLARYVMARQQALERTDDEAR